MDNSGGAILSNQQIIQSVQNKEIIIEPFDIRLVRGASICLRLGYESMRMECTGTVDVRLEASYPLYKKIEVDARTGLEIPAKRLVLASTYEKIALPRDVVGWLSNLSGLARLGLQVVLSHLVSPGYGEHGSTSLTLELFNTLDVPIKLYSEMRICHLTFLHLQEPATTSYDSQVGTYARQAGPRGSRFYTDF